MGKSIRLKKGYDIKLLGEASKEISEIPVADIFAVKPTDYLSITPKLVVKEGDEVLAGSSLFFDKKRPEINFPSPVSGEVVEIVRGAKRKVLEIRILADKTSKYAKTPIPTKLEAQNIKDALLKGNLWSLLRQRPFSIIPSIEEQPKAIFVSTFDTAPLAPDLSFVIEQNKIAFDKGLAVLSELSSGNLEVGTEAGSSLSLSAGTQNEFSGPHPSGNVGVQIHHVSPIKAGETIWYLDAQDVIILGEFFNSGEYHAERLVPITGSEVSTPSYIKAKVGQSLTKLFSEQVSESNVRFIQGNVLSGAISHKEDFLSFYTSQLTVIPEGNKAEFLGWLLPSAKKLSLSRTYFSWLMPNKKYDVDTNTHGEERAFVMSGQYEKVLPMNIMPVQLLKAIIAGDIEKMEALGIYEIAEEDLALCEFVCTSKIEVQKIVREGLDLMRTEG
ncbi:Na(+)-translocating NADH-quinone reductase subunit A [Arcticibacterium luteifluviistationis]|uniref:Na(+)-translocating NADH-quinone reductase subunit A n=1 Tax=Arcticibacterium luteifluviistationis TaxID=1784714 RepID=A0A2Z4G9M2_9BACT|nr:Na(+)-translocating NADH-quinone reductase subunit A [Arcticibacterium luteifluviistationis]AWV97768.1 NADH:ubiquinone reductase (Na(+)-transporting) subunit A [Arcticibacterium luteifluviistationis]